MRVLRFLSIPVIAMGTLALATVTASANTATISAKLNCTSATKVCFDLAITATNFSEAHTLHLTLLGHKKGAPSTDVTTIGNLDDLTISANGKTTPTVCLTGVTTSDFDSFSLRITAGDRGVDVNGKAKVDLGPFDNNCPASPSPTPTPTPTATPTGTPTPTASASAVAAVTLAQTGGFDFRFPLIGLVLLVAGGALYLISASRGRSANTK